MMVTIAKQKGEKGGKRDSKGREAREIENNLSDRQLIVTDCEARRRKRWEEDAPR